MSFQLFFFFLQFFFSSCCALSAVNLFQTKVDCVRMKGRAVTYRVNTSRNCPGVASIKKYGCQSDNRSKQSTFKAPKSFSDVHKLQSQVSSHTGEMSKLHTTDSRKVRGGLLAGSLPKR